MRNVCTQAGYIALASTIIMTALIGIIVLTVSMVSYYSRIDILFDSFKEKSAALSESCAQVALLKMAKNISYAGGETVTVGSDSCQILPMTTSGLQKIITTQAQFQGTVTNYKITVTASSLSIISWEEVSKF